MADEHLRTALERLVAAVRSTIPPARHGLDVSIALNAAERALRLVPTDVTHAAEQTLEDAAQGTGRRGTRRS